MLSTQTLLRNKSLWRITQTRVAAAKADSMKQEENEAKAADIRGDVTEIGWGNQIRSYVMQPYTMVKDHRTEYEVGNAQGVLDGDLDGFMQAYLKYLK